MSNHIPSYRLLRNPLLLNSRPSHLNSAWMSVSSPSLLRPLQKLFQQLKQLKSIRRPLPLGSEATLVVSLRNGRWRSMLVTSPALPPIVMILVDLMPPNWQSLAPPICSLRVALDQSLLKVLQKWRKKWWLKWKSELVHLYMHTHSIPVKVLLQALVACPCIIRAL